MKLCFWPGAPYGLAILAFLCNCATAVERRYYIAAVNINWDYTAGQQRTGPSYKKVVYREYNEGFTQAKTHPLSSGLLGPTLRGQEGDTIIVTFKNMADHPCSIHPHGIAYGKQSEGSLYFDNTSLYEKEDDVILPGKEHTYQWEVTSEVAPMDADPPCITYTYFSHFDIVKDYNTGLIGTMLICKKGTLDGSGNQLHFHQEAVLLFGVFDENKSWYSTGGPEQAHNVKYTINGYTNGSIPDLDICAHSKVSWHLLGMSSEPELFSVHFNGQALLHDGHKTSSIGIISGTATSASMNGIHPGRWLISSHISRHLEAGLHGYLNIKTCDEYTAPKRRLTIQQKQESQVWTYYIAAEEVTWDYAPNMKDNMDGDFRSKYLKQGPQRIGKKYKKAVFTQYKDGTFKERAEDKQRKKELGILGPVIRAQIRDVIKIVFKNKASRPYSIYPHGLTIDKAAEGASYPAEGNQTHGIQPGQNYTYTWSVSEEDTPTDSDPRCLTRMYHSAVDTPRDIASGLVGPLLICKSQSLNKKNVQLKADKEQHAMFTVFDENKSWYHDENINTYCSDPKRVKRDDPEFYKSNVMHTINGYVYESGQELGFCNGEIVTWHVSSVGEQDYIQTATFYGHTFELKNREEDMLSLFPMTGETITMNMLNIGIWLLASLNSHDSTKGMRVKFKDLECFRDYVMEYDYEQEKFTVWKPAPLSDIKKEEPKQIIPIVVDEDTDNYAEEFGLRAFKNVKNDAEFLDLSMIDFDDGLLPTTETKSPAPSDELDKSHNATFASFNQIHGLSTEEAGLDKRQSSNKVLNESTKEPLLNMTSISDSKPEVMSNNDTDSVISNPPVVERKVCSASTKPVNETESVSTNVTLDTEINTNIVENSSSSLETDSFSAYTTLVENASSSLETDSFSAYTTLVENASSSLETDIFSAYTTLVENVSSSLEGESVPGYTTQEENVSSSFDRDNVPDFTTHVENVSSSFERDNVPYFTTHVENVSSSFERDRVSVNTSHSPVVETNITHTMNETHISPTNTSITSSDAPVGDRNITMEGDSPSLNSSESNLLISNQTLVNKTVIQKEANTKNNSNLAHGDHDSSGHVFIYHVPSPDSLSNSSETQTEEDFVLLNGGLTSEVLTDYKTVVEYNVSPMDTPEEIGELNENTTRIQELNSTKVNYTSEMFSQINSETENIFNLSLSSPLRNGTLQSNESDSSNATLSDSSLDLESEITENGTSSTNATMKSHSEILRNASELFSSDSTKNMSFSLGPFNVSITKNGSESESEEEVVIYLKNNHSEAILTSHLYPKEEHWGYEGNHELVHIEIPDHMNKYISDNSAANKPKTEKKKKVVHQRVKPKKGYGMKTKKRKEYKPQPPSDVSPKGFSPRGFGPSGLTPRGSRPISSEEDLMEKSIVIGVPRRDFNDYEIYVPKHEQTEDLDAMVDTPEEYEYIEYKDPYSKTADIQSPALDVTSQHFLKIAGDKNTRTFFITVEEEEWDYAGYGQRRPDKSSQKERPTSFKKAVFRKYLDSTFSIRDIRGEMDEHLGILGPVIKAEVDQTVMVFFRNLASRPYSLHANGVKYLKQMEGLSYEDESPYWYKQDDAVQPNSTFIYMWTINSKSGPQNNESDCRTWTYYSAVNPERDINSGLIGPLLVCRKGTLDEKPLGRREFVLLFMTFDENKSWYYEENRERIERKNKRAVMDPNFTNKLKFDAINGIIYSLKGLRMYTNQLAKWHLINMGSPKDLHSVHFHGQTFINKELKDHRQGVYPLLPGGFATLEMLPSKPGLWQLESEVGLSQQRGMQTLFLVLDKVCDHPLGFISGTVKDEHITASDYRGQWYPHLARLHNTGKYNAWSTTKTGQYIQVDFQRPVVISKVATQGAKQLLAHNFVLNYTISYSTDKKKWTFYKGDSDTIRKTFEGNSEAYDTKENIFFPPLIGRYVRLYPLQSYNYPTVRLEYYGCELDGCSVPLGMESGVITDAQITASSVATHWYSGQWHPWYARLNKYGTVNAWRAKNNDIQPWIQVELKDIKKITGIITQGAKSYGNEMFVTTYSLEYSEDGMRWTKYTDDEDYEQKTFQGNTDNNGKVKNYIYPPIFSKFIRIIPKQWQKSITMRIELLGCDFE
ncbi:venom prothrombin activator oscutarin-C non-catalytic subunit isoform X1 [Carassius auratus]|uniref:ferroxidase n=1 Tax=Carassius auratus TaxID=7957 RepID=A0A6P6Q2S3_CARAU|nr:venom prothrombin activator oscutarin-C non-catalytic subunit-like isoform X1 [Carassius auratus]